MTSILGWDIGRGAGGAAVELGSPQTEPLAQIRLFAPPYAGAPCWTPPGGRQSQCVDVWNLDPRLRIVFTCFRQQTRGAGLRREESGDLIPLQPKANVTGTIAVVKIVKGANPSEGIIELPNPITADVLAGAGADLDDGCEISSGAQGLRFRVSAGGDGDIDYDVVATLIAIPNIAYGCPEIAKMAVNRLHVVLPAGEILFDIGGG